MKKFFSFMALATLVLMPTCAQNNLVAVLSHGENLNMFYGSSALIDAVDAADHGDVITLSEGTFSFADISKGITIRGAGSDKTRIAQGTNSTQYQINVPSGEDYKVCMEGLAINTYTNSGRIVNIYGNSSNLYLLKCVIPTGISFGSTSSVNATLVDCNINGFALNGSCGVKLSNCIVSGFSNVSGTTSKADFFNCMISANYSKPFTQYYRTSFVNCILFYDNVLGSSTLSSDITAMNSLIINAHFSGTVIDCTSLNNDGVKAAFVTYTTNSNQYGNTYIFPATDSQLTDDAKTTYLGTDGKEVGIYGGQYPYTLTPNYPLITKMNVAKQATADNKLSVEIEVSAVE